MIQNTTICAIATAAGMGAIAVVRLSGKQAIEICDKVFVSKKKGKKLVAQKPNTIHFGTLYQGNEAVDEVLVSIFHAPHSYTGENVVEISCHGSPYIQQRVLHLFLNNGATLASAGEFTLRAFLNGKLDLTQAEAVADLIASHSEADHRVAMQQMRGGFSSELQRMRHELLNFISLIELELDFSEEDVEFADRRQLATLVEQLLKVIENLTQSFALGNVIKNGIPTVIAGPPNAGKSTLLNVLLNEERAIVSEIAGTTRDFIEDEVSIEGIRFRFIDTAGLRHTNDTVEAIGIQRAKDKIRQAALLLYMFDMSDIKHPDQYLTHLNEAQSYEVPFIMVGNKIDCADEQVRSFLLHRSEVVMIAAKKHLEIDKLKTTMLEKINVQRLHASDVLVTNARHYEALSNAAQHLTDVLYGLQNHIPTDLIAMNIRQTLHYLGLITGEITTDEILGNIFKNFCIGK